jgi:hypothetical protein
MDEAVYYGLDGFEDEAHGQCAYFESRSPCHAAFLRLAADLLAHDAEVRDGVLAAWSGRSIRARYERPLLLCAAVRFDALGDSAHPLAAGLGPEPTDVSTIRADAVRAAVLTSSALGSIRNRFVQTNEVTRACVWRLPLGIVNRHRPCILADLGCSAGLNLVADRIDLGWKLSDGAAVPLRPANVVRRLGFDRAPVDVRDEEARRWLRACLWPGQTGRLRRFEQALRCARDAVDRGEMHIEVADATEMPLLLGESQPADVAVFAYQTIVLDYLLPEIRDAYEDAMRTWLLGDQGRRVWAEFERASAEGAPGPAEIRIHFATSDAIRTLVLASGEYHPETLAVNVAALAELEAAFS